MIHIITATNPEAKFFINYLKLKKYSAVVIVTDHDFFNYKKILSYSRKVYDTRGVFNKMNNSKIIKC